MKVKCFGIAKEITGRSDIDVTEEVQTVADLRSELLRLYPAAQSLNSWMIAVNHAYAVDDQPILPSDEVAIIPPVSGG